MMTSIGESYNNREELNKELEQKRRVEKRKKIFLGVTSVVAGIGFGIYTYQTLEELIED